MVWCWSNNPGKGRGDMVRSDKLEWTMQQESVAEVLRYF
jgi:hypothetical protein